MPYLLTPGPLTTSRGVKAGDAGRLGVAGTWNFAASLPDIRQRPAGHCRRRRRRTSACCCRVLAHLRLKQRLARLRRGARTPRSLVVMNGAYGLRAAKILDQIGARAYETINKGDSAAPSAAEVRHALEVNPEDRASCSWFIARPRPAIIIPIDDIVAVCKEMPASVVMVDAMSSFGAVAARHGRDSDMDIMVSSSNKCIEGRAGIFLCAGQAQTCWRQSAGYSHSAGARPL